MVGAAFSDRRRGKSLPLTERDYAGCPLPRNLPAPPHGDCLIWTGALNGGGYGVGTFPSGEGLAHRVAFRKSRGCSGENVLHLCHRRCCVQPSHLYSGSKQDNADDRLLRESSSVPEWSLFARATK